MKLILVREKEGKTSTTGRLIVPGLDKTIYVLEDLWMGNKVGNGRVPAGTYKCTPHGWNGEPVKYKQVWRLEDKPPRSAVLIHNGNDYTNTGGCLLVGLTKSPDFVGRSVEALNILRDFIGNRGFMLEIIDAFGI